MNNKDESGLLDILIAAETIQNFLYDITEEKFRESQLHQSAVIRQLEIIGEATKGLSHEFKNEYPILPWRKMADLRDILIHDYSNVNIDAVWTVVLLKR